MNPIILYRAFEFLFNQEEIQAMCKYFRTTPNRATIKPDDLVIGRLSVLPYYNETHQDISLLGGKLINGIHHHSYLADLSYWYPTLIDLTPKTWFSWSDIDDDGPFVLKGKTNSRKNMWKTHMFAKDKQEALLVSQRLQEDEFISNQGICYRKYVPLNILGIGLNGMPIAEEYRFFIYKKEIVASGFYWSSHLDQIETNGHHPDSCSVPQSFMKTLIDAVFFDDMFYVADVAKTEDGNWTLIELNDACMSGLSCIEPEDLYRNLRDILQKEGHICKPF